jgi:hypothetical protein
MTRWEYKSVTVARAARVAGDWTIWVEDDKPLPGPVSLLAKWRVLGEQGWEMISAIPISNHCTSTDTAGFTSQVTYVFKRPVPAATPPMLPKG